MNFNIFRKFSKHVKAWAQSLPQYIYLTAWKGLFVCLLRMDFFFIENKKKLNLNKNSVKREKLNEYFLKKW